MGGLVLHTSPISVKRILSFWVRNKILGIYLLSYLLYYLSMPTVGTYLTNEDYEKYNKIKASKPGAWTEFIHEALNADTYFDKPGTSTRTRWDEKKKAPVIEKVDLYKPDPKKDLSATTFNVKGADSRGLNLALCKHNREPGKCPYKGCVNNRKVK